MRVGYDGLVNSNSPVGFDTGKLKAALLLNGSSFLTLADLDNGCLRSKVRST